MIRTGKIYLHPKIDSLLAFHTGHVTRELWFEATQFLLVKLQATKAEYRFAGPSVDVQKAARTPSSAAPALLSLHQPMPRNSAARDINRAMQTRRYCT
jgi:hypothetical protein